MLALLSNLFFLHGNMIVCSGNSFYKLTLTKQTS